MKIKSILSLCISVAILAIAAIQLNKDAKAEVAEEEIYVRVVITNGAGRGNFSGKAINQSTSEEFKLDGIPKSEPPAIGGTLRWGGGDQNFDVYVCSDLGYGGHMVIHLFPQSAQEEFTMTVSEGCPKEK